ncbi:MAG: hypothetical protein AAF525_00270 [Pseudomonadota bacterium]
MDSFPNHFETPEDAYHGFFRADSAKSAEGWAAVMSYPHVRVSSRGRLYYCETPEQYAAEADWAAREATGWVRSVGHDPVRLHTSEHVVHLVGGWTRYNKDDEPILTNQVTYILTRPESSWGIQARLGVDSFTRDGDDGGRAAVAVAEDYVEAHRKGDYDTGVQYIRYPFVQIGVGGVVRIDDAVAMRSFISQAPSNEVVESHVEAVQVGSNGVVASLTRKYSRGFTEESVGLVARDETGKWKIAGASAILQTQDHDTDN